MVEGDIGPEKIRERRNRHRQAEEKEQGLSQIVYLSRRTETALRLLPPRTLTSY